MEEPYSSQNWYKNAYSDTNVSADKGSLVFKVMHSFLELGITGNPEDCILEIGGNRGEHVPFVRQPYSKYIITDLRQLDPEEYSHLNDPRLEFRQADCHSLDFEENQFDRVIVTCVFHHLTDPSLAAREILRVLKPGGKLTVLLPNDPGLFYRFARGLTTLRRAKKNKVYNQVQLAHAYEHRNHFLSLREILLNIFSEHQIRMVSFPFGFRTYNLGFISRLEIIKVNRN
jgi:phosphatidylethanolamine/phosphatidyl-N-methylethanolamine N-methyltransferase